MTKYEKYRKLHIRLWKWLAENPDKDKSDWPGWKWNGGKKIDLTGNVCFACDYVKIICPACPIDWGENRTCLDDGSAFERWEHAGNPKETSDIANEIASMWPPEKRGKE